MISAVELYLVLKLDSIAYALLTLGVTSSASSAMLLIAGLGYASEKDTCAERHCITKRERALMRAKILRAGNMIPKFFKASAISLCVSILFWALFVLTPTTKQMAAIMVVPKIVTRENVEALSNEAKDLYDLAKEYFRESAKADNRCATK